MIVAGTTVHFVYVGISQRISFTYFVFLKWTYEMSVIPAVLKRVTLQQTFD